MLINMLKPKFAIVGSNKREKEETIYQKFVKYVREAASKYISCYLVLGQEKKNNPTKYLKVLTFYVLVYAL